MQSGCVNKVDVLLVCTTRKCNLFGKVISYNSKPVSLSATV